MNYVFRHPHQLYGQDDEYDLEQTSDLTRYLPDRTLTTHETFGEEDQQLYAALDSDFDEAPAVIPLLDKRAELENYRPHSLSTIPSSRASQYAASIDDSDDINDYADEIRRSTTSVNRDKEHSDETQSDTSSRSSPAIQSHPQTPPNHHR